MRLSNARTAHKEIFMKRPSRYHLVRPEIFRVAKKSNLERARVRIPKRSPGGSKGELHVVVSSATELLGDTTGRSLSQLLRVPVALKSPPTRRRRNRCSRELRPEVTAQTVEVGKQA